MASNNPLFGVVAFDSDGRPLTQKEREAIAKNAPPVPMQDDNEWFTPSDLPQLPELKGGTVKEIMTGVFDDMKKQPNILNGPVQQAVQENVVKPVAVWIGNGGFILLGIVFVVLAFLVTDAGKSAVKMVATRGAVK